MFELALKARLPIISVVTDDLVNFTLVMSKLSGHQTKQLTKAEKAFGPYLFWTHDLDLVTADLYKKLLENDHQLVVVNPAGPHPLVVDTGVLPTPEDMLVTYLKEAVGASNVKDLLPCLKGVSLKAAGEVVQLTQARTGATTPAEVRKTRLMLSPSVQGLFAVDTSYDFYLFPPKLKDWLDLNKKYFLSPTHHKLVPRGILLEGSPGVGKSMAAKAVARHLQVPLYRLDVATTLDKYIGASEARVARILGMVDREEPCVVLIDEVEKIFGENEDSGVTTRILSQLLWWLAEHTTRVFVVMTTNNLETIPKELYRQGRIDLVMKIPRMGLVEANSFAQTVFHSIVGAKPSLAQVSNLSNVLSGKAQDDFSHAEISEIVYTEIKRNNWYNHLTNVA